VAPVFNDVALRLRDERRGFEVDIPDSLQTTAAPGAVRHMLSILLENSLLHGRGKISVTAKPNAEWLVLRVADDGPGLPLETGEAINDLQRQLTSSQKPNIGLPLAVALAVGVGGRIEWIAREPNVVQVYLPTAGYSV
jgi:signal transduction histidine kinase